MSTTPPPPDGQVWLARVYNDHAETARRLLRRRYGWADPDVLQDALTDALFHLDTLPERPADADVPTALYRAARDRAGTALRSDRRRRGREEEYERRRVTHRRDSDPTPDDAAADREVARLYRAEIARTPDEERALDLWAREVADPAEVAGILGWEFDDAERVLNRLRQRLVRLRRRLGPEDLT